MRNDEKFIAICNCDLIINNTVYNCGPWTSNSPTLTLVRHPYTTSLIKNKSYSCMLEYDLFIVYDNDSNGSYYYVFEKHEFNYYFYTSQQLRKEKLKKLGNGEMYM